MLNSLSSTKSAVYHYLLGRRLEEDLLCAVMVSLKNQSA